MLTGSVCLGDV
jgi:hypothetical protein